MFLKFLYPILMMLNSLLESKREMEGRPRGLFRLLKGKKKRITLGLADKPDKPDIKSDKQGRLTRSETETR